MKRIKSIYIDILYGLMIAFGLVGVQSCNLEDIPSGGVDPCRYNTRVVYHYNRENTSRKDELPVYVKSLTEYLFDEEGVLLDLRQVEFDVCSGQYRSDRDLPSGRYSVIVVGNQTAMSEVTDAAGGTTPTPGITRRENLILTLVNRTRTDAADAPFDNCGRLFHAYRTFSVVEDAASEVKIDMVHSHCVITFDIRWKGTPPASADRYYVLMRDVPSQYHLMPEFIYATPMAACTRHVPELHDAYEPVSMETIHHIPWVHNDTNIITHRQDVNRVGASITGQIISYRLRNAGQSLFGLYAETDSPDGKTTLQQVMKDIHINDFLTRTGINLDHSLRQEYNIAFEIDPQTGLVDVFFASIGDWDEGSLN